jgi:hypothetical protein
MFLSTDPTDLADSLAKLRTRFISLGYAVRDGAWFSPVGLLVFIRPEAVAGELPVVERKVAVYPRGDRWEARVTRHGGPHWIRGADSSSELIETVRHVLAQEPFVPDPTWTEVW